MFLDPDFRNILIIKCYNLHICTMDFYTNYRFALVIKLPTNFYSGFFSYCLHFKVLQQNLRLWRLRPASPEHCQSRTAPPPRLYAPLSPTPLFAKKRTAATNARTPAGRRTASTAFLQDCSNKAAGSQSRRIVVQTGGLLGLLAAVFDRLPALAEDDRNDEPGTSSTTTTASKPNNKANTETWYGYRGEGFRMTIPPDFEDIVEYDDSGTSLYGERAKVKPFAARFASPDRKEVLSVVVRNGSQMRLSFLQTQDITEFGSLEEAAKVFVPAGSKIVAAAALKPTDSRVLRTYYVYEFLARDDKRVVMSAAAAGGRVFVFGAMAPNSIWKEVGSRMRSAAVKFALI